MKFRGIVYKGSGFKGNKRKISLNMGACTLGIHWKGWGISPPSSSDEGYIDSTKSSSSTPWIHSKMKFSKIFSFCSAIPENCDTFHASR